LPSYIAEAIVV